MVFPRSGLGGKQGAHQSLGGVQRGSATRRYRPVRTRSARFAFFGLRPRALLRQTRKRRSPFPYAARRIPRAGLTAEDAAVIVLLMGPAGSGKTTIGELLAARLGWEFADGDSFHSPANIEKMAHGVPLDSNDRIPWLYAIREAMEQWTAQQRNVVLACSALKKIYREFLQINSSVKLVYLKGTYELLRGRLHARKGHYATEQILKSQLADLEEPADAITIDVARSPEEIVLEIRRQLSL